MFTRFLAAVVVCGVGVSGAHPVLAGNLKSLQVFRAVQHEVLSYPQFTIFDNVEAQIQGGIVTLTGKVTAPFKSTEIARRVARVDGVTRVRNRIEVLPASQFDDELRLRLAQAIYGHPSFAGYGSRRHPPIHIIVERGRVTLEGVVDSDADRLLARSIAASFLTFDVNNRLKTNDEVLDELERL
jgi:hyperosmotically inducible protein